MTSRQLSLITSCKGRLDHLRQSLPLMVAAGDSCEVVVVDYDCPEGTAAWVGAHYPQVKLVEVREAPDFNKARALNLGAQAAASPWLMFIDADILLAPGFAARVLPLLGPRRFLRPQPLTTDTWGSFLVHRDDFFAQGGYDEILQGWGCEDDDLYYRLQTYGKCSSGSFPGSLLSALRHDDAMRTRFHAVTDQYLNQRGNALYLHIKYDLMRLAGGMQLDVDALRSIYAEVRRAVAQAAAAGQNGVQVQLRLPDGTSVPIYRGTLQRQLTYSFAFQDVTGASDRAHDNIAP